MVSFVAAKARACAGGCARSAFGPPCQRRRCLRLRGQWQRRKRPGMLGRRQSPRLCGWLCEVSFRATSPAAAVVLRGRGQGVGRWRCVGRRHSPRLCGWLREVSLRATLPAAVLSPFARPSRQRVERRRILGRRHSPRLCGWLCEVSLRATSSAAVSRVGETRRWRRWRRRVGAGVAGCGRGSGALKKGKGSVLAVEFLGVTGRPSIGGATKVTPELGVGNPLNKEPHNGPSAKRGRWRQWRSCAGSARRASTDALGKGEGGFWRVPAVLLRLCVGVGCLPE